MTPTSTVAPFAGPQTVRVTVVGAPHAYGVVAVAPIEQGSVLFPVDGIITNGPSRYSIQIDDDLHIDLAPDTTLNEQLVRYPWRFLNHSCEPNAIFRERTFVALRPIDEGESVTYDYNTTELDMAVPFDCRCGRDRCLGRIRGFAHLSFAEQTRLRPWLAGHLRRRLDSALQFARA